MNGINERIHLAVEIHVAIAAVSICWWHQSTVLRHASTSLSTTHPLQSLMTTEWRKSAFSGPRDVGVACRATTVYTRQLQRLRHLNCTVTRAVDYTRWVFIKTCPSFCRHCTIHHRHMWSLTLRSSNDFSPISRHRLNGHKRNRLFPFTFVANEWFRSCLSCTQRDITRQSAN